MNFDLTWTITAIIAVASILSPVFVTLLNNNHDYKVRKLDIDSKIKQEVVTKEFNKTHLNYDFQESLNLLFVYFDVDDKLINNVINKQHSTLDFFQEDVTRLMKDLSKQIKSK